MPWLRVKEPTSNSGGKVKNWSHNEETFRPINYLPALHINVNLATKMGWLKNGSTYELGPNLQIEFFKDEIPDIGVVGDLHDKDGLPVFWTVSKYPTGYSFLKLSIYCDWRFLNLNKAFEVVVGNQVTDLLRGQLDLKRCRYSVFRTLSHSIYSRAQTSLTL